MTGPWSGGGEFPGGELTGTVSKKAKRWMLSLSVAVKMADALLDMESAARENVADEAPCVTVTEAGPLKIELLLTSPTERPPDGAG